MPDFFSKNPLFQRAEKYLRDAARREFRNTSLGRLMGEVERFHRDRHSGQAQLGKVVKRLTHFSRERMLRELLGTDIGHTARQIEHYSKAGGVKRVLVNQFLGRLGPAGKMLRALIGPITKHGPARDVEAAIRLLRAFGYEILPPPPARTRKAEQRGTEAARQFLEEMGYEVAKPGEPGPERTGLPFGIPSQTTAGAQRQYVDIPMEGGKRRFPVGHPLVTGEMVAAESSNVHSYGYDVEHWILYVRFLAAEPGTGQKSSAPGALYRYHHVPPGIFARMHNAPSKGVFIWDNIRERGTVSGHQFDYELVGVTQDYVPRKATLKADGEWFIPRSVRTQKGRVLTSNRPALLARPMTLTPRTRGPLGPRAPSA